MNKLTIIILSLVVIVSFFIIRNEAEEIDPLPIEFGGALPEAVAKLPAYNETCVDILQATKTQTIELSEFKTVQNCLAQLKDSLSEAYFTDVEAKITNGNIEFLNEDGLTRIVKAHIQATNDIQIDRETIKGKIIILPTIKTISELKPILELTVEKL